MAQVKCRLLRPLNNQKVGKIVSYDKADADRLASTGAVAILGSTKPRQAPKPAARSASKRRKPA